MVRAAVAHVFGMPAERPARPCRAARLRRHQDACRLRPSGRESAVELCLGKNGTGQLQYIVGPPQFFGFALKLLLSLRLACRDASTHADIDFKRMAHSFKSLTRSQYWAQ